MRKRCSWICISGVTLELPLQILQVEGGDVVVELSEEECLVVNGKVLSAASHRFKARLNTDRWGRVGSRDASHNLTKERMKVFRYRLALIDGHRRTWIITDENDSIARDALKLSEEEMQVDKTLPFYLQDDYSTGFMPYITSSSKVASERNP
ncbi:hypothetical protein Slin14017_G107450 [Septoria linicola]|nr:hypothetical protein Slin14017_G107450 [Septoria linicola]